MASSHEDLQARPTARLRASQAVVLSLDVEQMLQAIAREAAEIAGVPVVRLFLLEEDGRVLRRRAGVGLPPDAEQSSIPVGEGISRDVVATGQPLAVADCRAEPRAHYSEDAARNGLVSYLGLPVKYQGSLFGVLVFNTPTPRTYTPSEIASLGAFATQAAVAIQNARLFTAFEQRAAELDTLREIGQAITSHLELSVVLDAVVAGTMRLLDNPFAQLILWDEATRTLRYGAARGTEAERVRVQIFELGRGVNGTVAQTHQPMILDDYQASPYVLPEYPDIVATITVPILFDERLLGVLHSHSTQPGRRFTPDDLRRLQMLAAQAAIAIQNARLNEQLKAHARDLEQMVEDRTRALQEAQIQLIQSEKLASVGTLAAGIAHELNQPLMVIRGYAQELLADERITEEEIREDLRRIEGQTSRMTAIITHLRDFSRQSKSKRQVTDLNRVVSQAFTFFGQQIKNRSIQVGQELEPNLPPLWADSMQLEQVLLNLVTNARDALEEAGNKTLTICTQAVGDDRVALSVTDTGPGIQPDLQQRIFDPFFTTKEVGNGTGLGLSICHGIVKEHGGEIQVESPAADGRGARFTILLPRSLREGDAEATGPKPPRGKTDP